MVIGIVAMDDKHLDIFITDTYTPITPGQRIVGLTDEIRVDDKELYVSAFVERDGCLLVERIENGKYVLPRDTIAQGEAPQDALFRIFRTKYKVDVVVGASCDIENLNLNIMNKTDICFSVQIDDKAQIDNLKWVRY